MSDVVTITVNEDGDNVFVTVATGLTAEGLALKVNKVGDTMTGTLTVPDVTLDNLDMNPQTPQPAHKEGRVFYNDDRKTLDFYNDITDVTINLPEEVPIRVFNNTGVTITNGQAVRAVGVSGGLPTIVLSQANSVPNAVVLAVATHDIEDQTTGYVTALGQVGGFDTSSFNVGDRLFLSATVPGGLTNQQEQILAPVGLVLESDANGSIFVLSRGVINITAIGQVGGAAGSPTQALTGTPVPVAGYDNTALPEINVTANFTAGSGQFEADFQPSSIGASGFYEVSFSVAGTYSANEIIQFTVYVNGSPTERFGVIDLSNNQIDAGSVSFTAITPEVIDNTETVEIFVEASGNGTFTYESLTFNVKRIGNA